MEAVALHSDTVHHAVYKVVLKFESGDETLFKVCHSNNAIINKQFYPKKKISCFFGAG